ncbi:hypothetical protein COW36_19550 [bacterium (Candidatus Blackallbacteria) CG17_big_fil_post_rev_8_21_14_2_50_48_46]|uniref:Zinc/iron-chelating domain-containing protein n=1 Tax=bacterium (Candidatus Blackallbacteria) CG17_big_fil_post_rev_8_21_14_2_50_48_46 TaxID=2014261 RepID=A0A2M7FZL5_9BACT|nr:MAG: hypothetical protein COW64_15745 [bacterium (Candidatus Blackallbacteria) CG18_big_fil_WC_8_21_14_2_50_49_26]PIW14848.1 MAG: hypothetical protein COW36_19550 [bacterium (Candidatus Blackallbacteria) CG17_big_fil_post_rev_8_21_14_2_50_48_46]PIW44415.1 MAG: hypothetical protein COW20_24125 [bacterium (Candidatus Blackallbacteria) CG13_big_fil_rev_8_21_14_2_50_49_14]
MSRAALNPALFEANLAVLKLQHLEAWQQISELASGFEWKQNQNPICYAGIQLPQSEEPYLLQDLTGTLYIFGLGYAFALQQVLQLLPSSTRVVVIESNPNFSQFLMHHYDFSGVLNDSRLKYLLDTPEHLARQMPELLAQERDLLKLQWFENPVNLALATAQEDPFLLQVFRFYAHWQAQGKAENQTQHRKAKIQSFYQKIEKLSHHAYQTYALTCTQGCAGCCKKGFGLDVNLRPLEWEALYSGILSLDAMKRQELFAKTVFYLNKNRDLIEKILVFYHHHLQEMNSSQWHAEYLKLIGNLREEPCPLLDSAEQCSVYENRPYVCRVFGNSYFSSLQAYTCTLDVEKIEKILLDEKAANRLLQLEPLHQELKAMHGFYPYGHLLYLWLFTHLDFENSEFQTQAQLDYYPFEILVNEPERLKQRLAQLSDCARRLQDKS